MSWENFSDVTLVSDDIYRQIRRCIFSDNHRNCLMESSDEDFLPDPERPRKTKEPPDPSEASGSRGKKTKLDESTNTQSGLSLHDDFTQGRCFFSI